MSKISIEDVEGILRKQNVDTQVVNTVIREMEEVIQEEKDNKVPVPKQKNEFIIVLSDPNNELAGKDFVGWVVTQKQGEDAGLILDKIRAAAGETNAAKKRKKNMIMNMADAFYGIKRFFLKSRNVAVKTKEPVRVLITDGKL